MKLCAVIVTVQGKVALISIGESDIDKVCQFVKDAVRLSPPTDLQPVPTSQDTVTDGVSLV